MDAGFKAYIAALKMEHRYNNPVVLVFTEILIDTLLMQRSKRRLRALFNRPAALSAPDTISHPTGHMLLPLHTMGDAPSTPQAPRSPAADRWQAATAAALVRRPDSTHGIGSSLHAFFL